MSLLKDILKDRPDDVIDDDEDTLEPKKELALFFSEKKRELYGSDDPVYVALARRDGISAFEETAGPLAKAVEEMTANTLAASSTLAKATSASKKKRTWKADTYKSKFQERYEEMLEQHPELSRREAGIKIRNDLMRLKKKGLFSSRIPSAETIRKKLGKPIG